MHEFIVLGKKSAAADRFDQTAAEADKIRMTPEMALEEVICDAAQRMLLDTDAGKKLAQWGAQSQQNKGFLEKVKSIIQDILNLLRSALKGVDPDSLAAQEFSKLEANAKKILADMFVDMSIDAGEKLSTIKAAGMLDELNKNTAQQDGKKYKKQVGYDYTRSFEQQIDDYKAGMIPQGDTLLLGGTPKVYQLIGFNALPMTINTTHVDYALYGTKDADHFIGEVALKQLPESIKHPVAVFISQTHGTTSVIALLNFKVKGKETVAPIVIDGYGKNNSVVIDSNAITSVYGKTTAIDQLYQAVKDEATGKFSLLFANKKEAISLLQRAGHKLSGTLMPHDGFYHRIREKNSPVKPKFDNVTETQQFKRWFGDWLKHPNTASKIVNSDGTPNVMYHGSPAQFTIFDKKKAKSSGQYGRGFYFTNSQSHAGTYGQQYSVYLNIRNPLKQGGSTVSRSQVQKFLEAVAENEDYSIENYGTYDVDAVLHNIMENASTIDAYQAIQNVSLTAIGDMVEAAELFNKVNGTKFDGIVAATETVAFRPEQIKSATDNIGTFDGNNPDIRYKLPTVDSDPYGDFNYSGLNWARNLGIITSKDTAIFERTINNEILRGKEPNSANGEYIIDTGKCLMFTDGDFHAPTLSRVVVFETEYESLTADAKELIYNDAKVTGDLQESLALIEETFGPGFASAYDARDYRTDGRQNGRGKGNNSSQPYRRNRPRSLKEILAQQGIKNFKLPAGEDADQRQAARDTLSRYQEALRDQKDDTHLMEVEFRRIARAYETQERRGEKKIEDLRARLKDEAKKHRKDQKIWEAEFERLLKAYDAAGRNIQKLEETGFYWDFNAQKEHAVKFVGCSW